MTRPWTLVVSFLLLILAGTPLQAGNQELKTLELSIETVRAFAEIPLQGIPRALLHDAAGVVIIPHVLKAGVGIDGRFGRGVLVVHQPDGTWSNPEFVSLEGVGIGGQTGVGATELVLVLKTHQSLDRALQGKLTLGGDVTVAAGPIGREFEAASQGRVVPEVCTYSRSRGLFVGVSLEGFGLRVDTHANEVFYGHRGGRPGDILTKRRVAIPAVETLRAELTRLSAPPPPRRERP